MPPSAEMQRRIVQAANAATDDECAVMVLALELAWAKKRRQYLYRETTNVQAAIDAIEKNLNDAVAKVTG